MVGVHVRLSLVGPSFRLEIKRRSDPTEKKKQNHPTTLQDSLSYPPLCPVRPSYEYPHILTLFISSLPFNSFGRNRKFRVLQNLCALFFLPSGARKTTDYREYSEDVLSRDSIGEATKYVSYPVGGERTHLSPSSFLTSFFHGARGWSRRRRRIFTSFSFSSLLPPTSFAAVS